MITIECPWCADEMRFDERAASVRCDGCSVVHDFADASTTPVTSVTAPAVAVSLAAA
jgi:hypothetical protein